MKARYKKQHIIHFISNRWPINTWVYEILGCTMISQYQNRFKIKNFYTSYSPIHSELELESSIDTPVAEGESENKNNINATHKIKNREKPNSRIWNIWKLSPHNYVKILHIPLYIILYIYIYT